MGLCRNHPNIISCGFYEGEGIYIISSGSTKYPHGVQKNPHTKNPHLKFVLSIYSGNKLLYSYDIRPASFILIVI